MAIVTPSLTYVPSKDKGRPLSEGYIYVGQPNLDPTIVANQKVVTLKLSSGGTVSPAPQPLRTSAGGVVVYNDDYAVMTTNGDFSFAAYNKDHEPLDPPDPEDLEYYIPNNASIFDLSQISGSQDGNDIDNMNDWLDTQSFDTVSQMSASTSVNLYAGRRVSTKGFHAVGDGGASDYNIVTTAPMPADGLSVILLSSGRFAVIDVSGRANIEQLGCRANDSDDITASVFSAIKMGIPIKSGPGTYRVTTTSSLSGDYSLDWEAESSVIFLSPGEKTSAPFVFYNFTSIRLEGMTWDGNRNNVTGNNAGFLISFGCQKFSALNTGFNDLRRYGYNIVGQAPINTNASVVNTTCTDIGVQSGGTPIALGEVIKCEDVTNVEIDGLYITNPSGTGNGQMQKCFFCTNVSIKNFDLNNVSPTGAQPCISNVRNLNYIAENISMRGVSQVGLEDNSNINAHYKNIYTETNKALIIGTDGAARGDRRTERLIIENWKDVATESLSFNMIGCKDVRMENVETNQTINLTRDNATDDRRSENITLKKIKCGNLNTSLISGTQELTDCAIVGAWSNTHVGTSLAYNVSYGSYSNGGETNVFVVFSSARNENIQISGSIAAGAIFVYRAPLDSADSPFSGVVGLTNYLPASPNNQWSMIDYHFYDYGIPTVNKNVVFSGAVTRSAINLTVSRVSRTMTFTSTEGADTTNFIARINFNDATLNSQP